MDEFKEVLDYDKECYDVLTPERDVVKQCWPNAGFYCAMDGSGRRWRCDAVEVRLSDKRSIG